MIHSLLTPHTWLWEAGPLLIGIALLAWAVWPLKKSDVMSSDSEKPATASNRPHSAGIVNHPSGKGSVFVGNISIGHDVGIENHADDVIMKDNLSIGRKPKKER